MDWREKSVTLGNVDKDEFDTALCHITVSENGISVAFKQVDDWKRIRREIGDHLILRDVPWAAVASVDATIDNLYYPHIDVKITDTADDAHGHGTLHEKRLYFHEDERDTLEQCLKAIQRRWRAAQQRSAASAQPARRDIDQDGAGEEARLVADADPDAADDEGDEDGGTGVKEADADTAGEDAPADDEPAGTDAEHDDGSETGMAEQLAAAKEKVAERRRIADDGTVIDAEDGEEDDGAADAADGDGEADVTTKRETLAAVQEEPDDDEEDADEDRAEDEDDEEEEDGGVTDHVEEMVDGLLE